MAQYLTKRAGLRVCSRGRSPGTTAEIAPTVTLAAIRTWLWQRLPFRIKLLLLWTFNAHFIIGTVAIITDSAGRVLLARHTYRGRTPWSLPGGWVRRGEDPARTVVREIREETALDTEVIAPLRIQVESALHLTVIYRAKVVGGAFRPSPEVSEVQFIEPGAWPAGLREDHRRLIEALIRHPAPPV